VAAPPDDTRTLVTPRVPLAGVVPSTRNASRVTVPVHQVIVALPGSFAATLTEKAAPAEAVAGPVT